MLALLAGLAPAQDREPLFPPPPLVAADSTPADLHPELDHAYALAYEQEMAGDYAAVQESYRRLLGQTPPSDTRLAEKLLYRIGYCERRAGMPEAARKTWRHLVENYPARDLYVVRTRGELKDLERDLDRIVLSGKVLVARDPAPVVVVAGEWGDEPAFLSDTSGSFSMGRKLAGESMDGRRYCLVAAEHPFKPLVAALACTIAAGSSNPPSVSLPLRPAITLYSRVVDTAGRPVTGAAIQVVGYDGDLPLPFSRLLPPVESSITGEFRVTSLVPGLRYTLTAVLPNCRLVSAAEADTREQGMPREGGAIACGPIIVRRLGEVSLRGRVVDDSGVPARVEVAALALPPVEMELVRVRTDREGRFVLRDIRENGISLVVEGPGYIGKTVKGLRPIGQDIDIIVKGDGLSAHAPISSGKMLSTNEEVEALEEGMREPLRPDTVLPPLASLHWLRGNPDTGVPPTAAEMKGHVVIWHFGSAYVEAARRAQYPGEGGAVTHLLHLYGESGLVCIWVLPDGESAGEPLRVALEACPGAYLASWRSGRFPELPEAGNIVVGRTGVASLPCTDLQLYKAVKDAVME